MGGVYNVLGATIHGPSRNAGRRSKNGERGESKGGRVTERSAAGGPAVGARHETARDRYYEEHCNLVNRGVVISFIKERGTRLKLG